MFLLGFVIICVLVLIVRTVTKPEKMKAAKSARVYKSPMLMTPVRRDEAPSSASVLTQVPLMEALENDTSYKAITSGNSASLQGRTSFSVARPNVGVIQENDLFKESF